MKEQIRALFEDYLENIAPPDKVAELIRYFRTEDESLLRELVRQELLELDEQIEDPEIEQMAREVYEEMLHKISNKPTNVKSITSRILRYGIGTAASILLVYSGVWLYKSHEQPTFVHSSSSPTELILPGKNGATLTLADGTVIKLSEADSGRIASESGIHISKTKDGQLLYQVNPEEVPSHAVASPINTLSTTRGETIQVQLPDGTRVWLNSASSLTYPTSVLGKERRVSLHGEAYMEVASYPNKPFVVETNEQLIEVLGTRFDISTYADEDTYTVLLDGAVRISAAGKSRVLKPGQKALSQAGTLQVQSANVEQEIAWTKGDFDFEGTPLREIMKQIARWYDVEVFYEGAMAETKFGGSISRSKSIYEVLNVLQMTQGVHFKIEGRRVTVMP